MRNAPTVVGSAFNAWFYWDGRRDSLWSQALLPLEAPDEMGSTRIAVLRGIREDRSLRAQYETLFGSLPDLDDSLPASAGPYGSETERAAWNRLGPAVRSSINKAFANVGKAIAAYERTLLPKASRFDAFVAALTGSVSADQERIPLSSDAVAGARLFANQDKTHCLRCHNGPLFTNNGFHNVGTGNFTGKRLDFGRVFGLRAVLLDEFNCVGPYSDADPTECLELRFLNKDAHVPLEGAFKVPSLRGASLTAPYFHDGSAATLEAVVGHYVTPPQKQDGPPHELRPLELTPTEQRQLVEFLRSL